MSRERLREMIERAQRVAIFTGAGVAANAPAGWYSAAAASMRPGLNERRRRANRCACDRVELGFIGGSP